MRRVIGFSVCVLLAAACGSSGGQKAAPPAPTTTTAAESAETHAWVTAATQGLLTDPSKPKDLTNADATCIARAMIDNITVARLKAAGATLSDLSDPSKDLPPTVGASVPAATRSAMGADMQACNFGHLIGSLVVDSVAKNISSGYQPDAKAGACVGAQFDSASRRDLVADIILNQNPSATDSSAIATIMVDCLDIGAMMAPSFHLTLSAAESTCINTEARGDKAFVAAIASEISGAGSGTNPAFDLFGARTVKCLTPEHILQITKAKP